MLYEQVCCWLFAEIEKIRKMAIWCFISRKTVGYENKINNVFFVSMLFCLSWLTSVFAVELNSGNVQQLIHISTSWGITSAWFDWITSIAPGTFLDYNPSVPEIHFNNSSISVLESGTFDWWSNLTSLDISGLPLISIEPWAFLWLDNVTALTMNSNVSTGFVLESWVFMGLPNLHSFMIEGSSVTSIEPWAFLWLTSVNSAMLYSLPLLTHLASWTFLWLDNLQTLGIAESRALTTMDVWTFLWLDNLRLLNMSDESVSNFDLWVFVWMENLQELDLVGFPVQHLKPWIFSDLSAVQNLQLANNHIDQLDAWLFLGLSQLQTLNLSLNRIGSLPDWVFDWVNWLQSLDLWGNQLKSIDDGFFSGMVWLQTLNLNDNKLTVIGSGLFLGIVWLQNLNLSSNQLKSMDSKLFDDLPNLQSLNLSFNQLTTLGVWVFSLLHNVTYLNLGYNSISSFPSGIFGWLSSLYSLYFHNNRITNINASLFEWLNSLADLQIWNDPIETISPGIFNGLNSLISVSLSSNCASDWTQYIASIRWYDIVLDNTYCVPVVGGDPRDFMTALSAHGYAYNANWYVQWSASIWLNASWAVSTILVPLVMASQNPNMYSEDYYQNKVEVQYEIWTNITWNGNAYTGILNNPELYNTWNVPWWVEVVALTRFGALTHEIDFDKPITVRIPVLGKNVWDHLGVYSSEEESIYGVNWPKWVFEETGTVENYNELPYVVFTTTHASRWAIGDVTPQTPPDTTPPIGTITYNPSTATTDSVTATLALNESWVVTNNSWSNEYVFTGNGEFTFTFADLAWNTGKAVATVTWIYVPEKHVSFGGGWWGEVGPILPIVHPVIPVVYTWFWFAWWQALFSGSVILADVLSSCDNLQWETNKSYCFAFSIWSTTKTTLEDAEYNREIRRSELAKMVSEYAVQILHQVPEQGKTCHHYNDVTSRYKTMDPYITMVCALGLMWVDNNGDQMIHFRPKDLVTRGEYMTVLSRMLYGRKYDISDDEIGKVPFYQYHLDNLVSQGIFNHRLPEIEVQRYMVFYTLYRLANKMVLWLF